jgi:hypothetical protein
VRYTTPNSLGKIGQEVCFQVLTVESVAWSAVEVCCGSLLRCPTTLSSTAGPLAFSSTNGVLLLKTDPLVDRRAGRVTKSEFERRAAEMKAQNLMRPRFRNLSPPRSIFRRTSGHTSSREGLCPRLPSRGRRQTTQPTTGCDQKAGQARNGSRWATGSDASGP